jgi:NADPH:quinone reductase-like Zn-dependent oxidoreductase
MKVIELGDPATLETLTVATRDKPDPAPGEICMRVRASSLN